MSGAGEERERLRAALRELVAERGIVGLTAAAVEARAGLDPDALRRGFGDLDACFASVWLKVDAALQSLVDEAFDRPGPWRGRIRAALAAELDFFAADEARARLYVSEAVFVDDPVRSAHHAAMRRRIEMLDAGRREGADPEASIAIAEAIAGATWEHLNRRIRAGRAADLPADLPELAYLAVMPYLGPDAAAAELRRR